MEKVKFSWKGYFEPTPRLWRKVGDGLLGISVFVTGAGIFTDMKWISAGALVIGVVGKFMTNFFTEE